MRTNAWLCGLVLVVSCSGSSSTMDAGGGSGGQSSGSGGMSGGSGGMSGGSGGSTGSGGSVGSGGADAGTDAGSGLDGGVDCSALEQMYADAVPAARACNPRQPAQCQKTAAPQLSRCPAGCLIVVQDDTKLNAIKAEWMQAHCDTRPPAVPCPLVNIACPQPTGACLVPPADGPGICQAAR